MNEFEIIGLEPYVLGYGLSKLAELSIERDIKN
jgi:hypothetical protein